MTAWRIALAALAFGTAELAIAAPTTGPNPTFTGADLSTSARHPTHRSVQTDGSAYVRVERHHD
jgi:hypothetical protein